MITGVQISIIDIIYITTQSTMIFDQISFRTWVLLMNCNHSSSGRSKVEIGGMKSNQVEVIDAILWNCAV